MGDADPFLVALATKAGEYLAWHVSDAGTKRRKVERRARRKRWEQLMAQARAGTWPPEEPSR